MRGAVPPPRSFSSSLRVAYLKERQVHGDENGSGLRVWLQLGDNNPSETGI
jgi:hypothetical protein